MKETFVLLQVGVDPLTEFMVRSVRRSNETAFIIQCSDDESPAVPGVDKVVRFDFDRQNLMTFRLRAFAALELREPAIYLDTDMLVLSPLCAHSMLAGADVAFCQRSFGVTDPINTEFKGMNLSEFSGKSMGDVFPVVACFTVTRSYEFWGKCSEFLERMDPKFHFWYGDQLAMKNVLDGNHFKCQGIPESKVGCLPEFFNPEDPPNCIHFKGPHRKQLMCEWRSSTPESQDPISVTLASRNQLAQNTRNGLPVTNSYAIGELLRLPKLFDWVECQPERDCQFLMFLAGADDGVALRFFWNGQYEKFTLESWVVISRQMTGSVIVDVGAHTGAYTLAALASGAKNVVSFEPYLMNYSRLIMNLRANGFKTDLAHPLAVGESFGNGTLSIGTDISYLSTGGQVGKVPGRRQFPITVVPLDEVLKELTIPVGLMKIDVEGHESKVLKGAVRTIARSKPTIFFECVTKESGDAVYKILAPLGYKFWLIDDHTGELEAVSRLEPEVSAGGGPLMHRLNRIASVSQPIPLQKGHDPNS